MGETLRYRTYIAENNIVPSFLHEAELPHEIDISVLPQGIIDGLRKFKFNKKSIALYYADAIKLNGAKSRHVQVAGPIDLAGHIDHLPYTMDGMISIAQDNVFYRGFESGSGSYGNLYIPKTMVEKVLGKGIDLTTRQKTILNNLTIGKNPKSRMRLLAMDNVRLPELKPLESMGLIKIDMAKKEVSITTKGKSLRF